MTDLSEVNMESEVFKKLKTLIEALTHSGSRSLDEEIFKQVKKISKSSQDNIPLVYNLVLTQLKKKNSQIRFSAFQICKELFKRSGSFRESVLKDLSLIFELTAEINSAKKLPPPKSFADSLKALAISTLKEWVQEFGESYKKLKVAFNYFEKCKQVDFTTLQINNSAEQVVENEQQRHIRVVNEEKLRKVLEEFNSNESEIQMTITSLSNCLSLLLPPAEEFFIPEQSLQKTGVVQNELGSAVSGTNCKNSFSDNLESNEDEENYLSDSTSTLREFGISPDYKLTLQLNVGDKFKVSRTEENITVIENAKDCVRLICNRFLPTVKRWIKIYSKCSNGGGNEIKKIIDLKEKLENILKKYNSIVIDDDNNTENNENSSDDEFEEVKKDGYEESVNFSEEFMLECLKEKSVPGFNHEVKESQNSSTETQPCPSTSKCESSGESSHLISNRKQKLLSIAPKLPYDIDLYHWEDEHLSTPVLISTKIDVDKFWGSAGSDDIHEIPNPDGVSALRTRVIEFTGKFEPVKWACRAPLPNGKLCPRKDRFKCPFHGKIVARDEAGAIQNVEDGKASDQSSEKIISGIPEFQDPEFLRDLQAATGVDLKIPERKGKKRKPENMNLTHKKMKTSAGALKLLQMKKLPGLDDVVKRQSNSYTRLSKKIFNRSSLKRVSAVLNKLDRKKFRDKYGDQFNYT